MAISTDPTISVLLPVRDDAEYLSQSLDSLFAQTYADFEVIALDAGSNDDSRVILDAIDDPRLRVEEVSAEASLYETLNFGLQLARGRFVARQEADGLSAPMRFERQARYLDDNPAVVAVGSAVHLLSPGGARRETVRLTQWVTIRTLMHQNEIVHGSVMIRRSALDAIGGYDPRFTLRGGYDLWLRLLSEGELHNIPDPLYNVRTYRDPVTADSIRHLALSHYFALHQHGYGERVSPERVESVEGLQQFKDELPAHEQAAYHLDVAQTLLRYGGRREARIELIESLRASVTFKAVALLAASFGGPLVDRFVPAEFQKYRFRELDRKKWGR